MNYDLILWNDKVGKSLARLIKKKRERAQINKIRNEKREVTTNTTEMQKIISDSCGQLSTNKMDNLYQGGRLAGEG